METKYIVNNLSGQTINGDITINGDLNITGTTNIRPYKVYTALLTRTGDSAPTPTILENTIGTITYSYDNLGIYSINSSDLFPQNKTVVFVQQQGNSTFGNTLNIVLVSEDEIRIVQSTSSGTNDADWGFPVSIEIKVYD